MNYEKFNFPCEERNKGDTVSVGCFKTKKNNNIKEPISWASYGGILCKE